MKGLTIAGTVLLVAIGVFYLAFGLLYASVGDYLFFHKAALPAGATDAFKPLYLGLMKLIGGASIALGVLGLYATFSAARTARGLGVLVVAYATPLVFAAFVAETLRAETGAPTSWNLMGILLALLAAGAALRLAGRSRDSKRA